jgi:homogentisate 1,2-dioxygenase
MTDYQYQSGFSNEFSSEALAGALPVGQNNPQRCPFGLYAEQLSGTAFTVPRAHNRRSWLYRIRPSVVHKPAVPVAHPRLVAEFDSIPAEPNQLRWSPPPLPDASQSVDWVQGLVTYCGAGSVAMKQGVAVHYYACNRSMVDHAFYNADGDLLIVPQHGALDIQTEFGMLLVPPGEICVIQRGIAFAVRVGGASRGYVCELFSGHFQLPELGPIGANGLANPRDFQTPVAHYERRAAPWRKQFKFGGRLFECALSHSPFDVVAWHGNYAPFKYNLARYVAMNSVTVDHPDPSIFTVLTAPSGEPGVAALDFVIFPPRWVVAERTFRPPYFHRNLMSEFMGLIAGSYDAKEGGGFVPGGASLHSCMTPHGPDAVSTKKAEEAPLAPVRYSDAALAFMFESTYIFKVTPHAMAHNLQPEYYECWQNIPDSFDPSKK